MRIRLFALASLLASTPVFAQKAAPGLWETTMTMKTQSGQMESAMAKAQEQMAKMPPDQRKMMEEMMARQGVGLGGGKGTTVRTCISKEQSEKGDVPDSSGNCKRESVERSGSTMRFKFACTTPPSSGSGEVTFVSDKSYSMKMLADTTVQGKAERMEINTSGHWLQADCGDLAKR